ncbi:hypothetical protein [Roseomonas sp. BN140053]|uniref:hypothetical protein n=1 Tax=Roseomonas sp. BN140053 TaxID=3391898 RepID=UPI0039ECD3ED
MTWRMKLKSLVATLTLACLGSVLNISREAASQSYPATTALEFLVQSNCIDDRGRPEPGVLPFQPECVTRRGLRASEGMAYRKHDWPAPEHRAGAPLGYQASDAYATTLAGYPAAVQTFDMGGGNTSFGGRGTRASMAGMAWC